MFDGVIGAINDFFREILFSLASCFMFILDIVWECIMRIATLNISDYISEWFVLIIVFVLLFLILRIIKIFVKTMFDDEYRMRLNISKLIINIVLASFTIGFSPIAFSFCCNMTSDAIDRIEYFIPSDQNISELKMSDILLESGRINMQDINADLSQKIDTSHFDINQRNDNNQYIYFQSYASLFLLIIESIVACFLFVLVGIQIAKRFYDIGLKYLLAPYAIAGMIDAEDKTFTTWIKLLGGDFIMNFVQIYGVYFLLFLCNNSTIQSAIGNDVIGICASIIVFLAGLVAILDIPTNVATLIGGHGAGALQSLQEVKTIMTMSKGVSLGIAGTTLGVGMGAAGGVIGGLSNGYQTSEAIGMSGKIKDTIKSGVGGGIRGSMDTVKTNYSGGYFGGGMTRGANILKSGVGMMKNNMSDSSVSDNQKGQTQDLEQGEQQSSQGKHDIINAAGLSQSAIHISSSRLDAEEQMKKTPDTLGRESPQNDNMGQSTVSYSQQAQSQDLPQSDQQLSQGKYDTMNDQSYSKQEGLDDIMATQYVASTSSIHEESSINRGGESLYSSVAKKRLGKKDKLK